MRCCTTKPSASPAEGWRSPPRPRTAGVAGRVANGAGRARSPTAVGGSARTAAARSSNSRGRPTPRAGAYLCKRGVLAVKLSVQLHLCHLPSKSRVLSAQLPRAPRGGPGSGCPRTSRRRTGRGRGWQGRTAALRHHDTCSALPSSRNCLRALLVRGFRPLLCSVGTAHRHRRGDRCRAVANCAGTAPGADCGEAPPRAVPGARGH